MNVLYNQKIILKMKKLFLFLNIFLAIQMVGAQTDFLHGISTANGTAGNVSFAIGYPFFGQRANADIEVSEGVMQAQLIRHDIVMDGCQNDPALTPEAMRTATNFFQGFEGIRLVFRDDTLTVLPAGHYDSTAYEALHYNWNGQYNYDSLTTLVLDVWPIYELYDTLYVDSADLADVRLIYPGLHGGPNFYEYKTVHDCDSLWHHFVNLCGGVSKDADGNKYASVFVGPYCWFTSNLRTTHYNNGEDAPSMIYYAENHEDTDYNLNTYGRLYTWFSAVHLPDGSDVDPERTTHGNFVTGICPPGWHIPEEVNMNSLESFDAFDLMADSLWLTPGNNSTGFNALPAGLFNASTHHFENMLGHAYYWSSVRTSSSGCMVCSLLFGCHTPFIDEVFKGNGLSVRCVKNQMFADDGSELND